MPQTNDMTSLTHSEIVKEASRCLNCKKPFCKDGCPVDNDIPHFIKAFLDDDLALAYDILEKKTNMPAICGKICPHEKQCEGSCVLNRKNMPVKIGEIESYIANAVHNENIVSYAKSPKALGDVAIIGSGPAGLSCAYILLKEGFNVTIYEKERTAGGILSYGIPTFRLSPKFVHTEIDKIKKLGAKFVFNHTLGKDIFIKDLQQKYDAIFLSTGANLEKTLKIDGNNAPRVIHANKFLTNYAKAIKGESNQDKDYNITKDDVAIVIGGGNVAMDTARTVKRLTDSVTVVYRRTKEEMPASCAEYGGAMDENIHFIWQHSPLQFVCENGILVGLKAKSLADNTETVIPCTVALTAIGSSPSIPDGRIELDKWSYIKIKDKPFGMTNLNKVFSAGDVVHGASTVVLAMREGRKTAYSIKDFILSK